MHIDKLILKTKFPLCSPDTVPNTEKYLRQREAVVHILNIPGVSQ
jgi:hypothetical protein